MTDRAQEIAGKLTKAQAWALEAIAKGRGWTPAVLGQAMMERPGATRGRTVQYKAQGYGRMGGTMMWRLHRMGLVTLSHGFGDNWHPTRAELSSFGLAVRAQLTETDHADQ